MLPQKKSRLHCITKGMGYGSMNALSPKNQNIVIYANTLMEGKNMSSMIHDAYQLKT